MKSHKHRSFLKLTNALCAICFLMGYVTANAANDGICSTASLANPNAIGGGMGGTGIPQNGGMGGTGVTDEHSGFGGTGIPVSQKGMGGTGAPVAENGFGGTGISVAEQGMGGTGISMAANTLLPNDTEGGIAIVGVITGFASICVDGVEVQYSASTPVFANGKASKLGQLAAGKMVMLKAERVGGQLQARAIGMFDAVAGPVGKLDVARQQMQVMGQTVRVDKNTIEQMRAVAAGTDVRVSGHRLANGEIVATRVDVSNRVDVASTIGTVTSVAKNSFEVNGTRVSVSDANLMRNLNVGSEVSVGGAWDGQAIKANHLESQPIIRMINRSDTAIVEGYLGSGGGNKLNLHGTELQFSKNKGGQDNINESKLVKIEISREKSGRWEVDNVETRKGKLFEKDIQFRNETDSNGVGTSGRNDGKSDELKSENSGSSSGSSSGSGSNSSHGGSSSGTSGGSSGRSHGSSGGGSSSRSSGSGASSGRSSGGGSSSSSGGSSRGGSGKLN